MSAENTPAPVCMTPGCGRLKPGKRGLCIICLNAYKRLVWLGDLTEDDAVRRGLIKPRPGITTFHAAVRDDSLAKKEAKLEILNGPVLALAEAVTMYLGGSKLKSKADQRIDMLKALAAVDREIQVAKAMIERENVK